MAAKKLGTLGLVAAGVFALAGGAAVEGLGAKGLGVFVTVGALGGGPNKPEVEAGVLAVATGALDAAGLAIAAGAAKEKVGAVVAGALGAEAGLLPAPVDGAGADGKEMDDGLGCSAGLFPREKGGAAGVIVAAGLLWVNALGAWKRLLGAPIELGGAVSFFSVVVPLILGIMLIVGTAGFSGGVNCFCAFSRSFAIATASKSCFSHLEYDFDERS